MDLHAVERVAINPGEWASVGTGLTIELPAGFDGQVRPRSGLAARHGLTLLNSPGTIDSDYRGEIGVILANFSDKLATVRRGDRVAQLVVARYLTVEWDLMDAPPESNRGAGGFGSTDSKAP